MSAMFFGTAFQYLGRGTAIICERVVTEYYSGVVLLPTGYVVGSPAVVTQTSPPVSCFLVFELEISLFPYTYIFSKYQVVF